MTRIPLATLVLAAAAVAACPALADSAAADWNGWYVGATAGGDWDRADIASTSSPSTPNDDAVAAMDSAHLRSSGLSAAVDAGYSLSSGGLLLGLEGDVGYFGLDAASSFSGTYPEGGGTFTVTPSVTADWIATLRPRLGFAAGRTLLYVTGGLAVADVHFTDSLTDTTGDTGAASASAVKAGWVGGGGAEYALSSGWSLRVEYLYTDLGSLSASNIVTGCAPDCAQTHDIHLTGSIVRVGVDYRFGR
jgi:outer membrane immunogenic protein